ncbi:MAG: hydroxymethylglutaryl-CoA synthase [Pseudomonadota bacterium]
MGSPETGIPTEDSHNSVDSNSQRGIGISGFASYLPPNRVQLADWCRWTGDQFEKIRSVVGSSFRMGGANENAYTMGATAVLRLIQQYNVDPSRIGYLALGTESSTDNSAGAVIIKGMVNEALIAAGEKPISRACEVPEFKHACLGGVYALKAATRYLATDGQDRIAIVVCSDIAEYERASSGEPTQGAGAVAMLLEPDAKLLSVNLQTTGSASAYRGPDFRKPFSRFMQQNPGPFQQPNDFPIFNGKYSTTCYVDEVLAAARDLFSRVATKPSRFMRSMRASFLHRPYQRMAETGLAFTFLLALALGDADDQAELLQYAQGADVDMDRLITELVDEPHVYDLVKNGNIAEDIYPLSSRVAKHFRSTPRFSELMTDLGHEQMKEVGNLYTASLPAWMAAGIENALERDQDVTGNQILTIGYGSGDAAEIIPMEFVPGWQEAAAKIEFQSRMAGAVDLDEEQYVALHEAGDLSPLTHTEGVFAIDRVGDGQDGFDDRGIEYYRLNT